MSDLIRLSLTTVAPDAIALARFYAEITGAVAKGDEYWAPVEASSSSTPCTPDGFLTRGEP